MIANLLPTRSPLPCGVFRMQTLLFGIIFSSYLMVFLFRGFAGIILSGTLFTLVNQYYPIKAKK
jgi:hypothetical protein